MRERRLGKALFLIACALCIALLFRMMRKLPDIRNKNGWASGIHQVLLMQAEKTVAPVVSMGMSAEEGYLERAFLHVAAPVIPYMEERGAWNLVENAARRGGDNHAGSEKALEVNDNMNDQMAWGDERIADEEEPWGDKRIGDDGESREDENPADTKLAREGGNLTDDKTLRDDVNLANERKTQENGKIADEALHQTCEERMNGSTSDMEDAGDWMESGIAPESRLADKKQILDAVTMNTYESLVKNFYVVDSTTMADGALLNAERFLAKDLRISQIGEGPQILIYHTHSQEGYADKGNPEATVVGAGRELTRILEEDYGYRVLHHEGVYDKPSRNGAYSRALPEVERILEENPSIQVVIDLHRDEMPEKVRLVTEVDGKKTARFMFFNGISRTRKTGELDYLKNQWLEENLAFSFQMEKAAQEYYPGLTRKIYLKGYRYNMHVCPKTLLIELGAQNNTYEEALAACGPLASLLDYVLSGGEWTETAIP